MNKTELYNSIVDLYKKTGQGAPGFLRLKLGSDEIDELIEDGLIKSITHTYHALGSQDEWLCLTGVYCPEEETEKGNYRALEFVRKYLGIDSWMNQKLKEYFDNNPKEKEKYENEYQEWLNINKDTLEKSFSIQKIAEEPTVETKLDENLIEYAKTRGWYKDNKTISECLVNFDKSDSEINQALRLIKELIDLKTLPQVREKYREDVKNDLADIEHLKIEQKNRIKIKKWLLTKPSDKKIQEYF